MKPILSLLRPYRKTFALAILMLMIAAIFNSAMTGLVTSLVDDVMAYQVTETTSRADEIFGYKKKLNKLRDWLIEHGVPIDYFAEQATTDALTNPFAWALLALILFSGQALFDFLGTYTLGKIGLLIVVHLRQSMMARFMSLSLRFFNQFPSGELLARVNTDVLRIQQAISVKMGEMVNSAANVVVFLVLAFVLDWKLSLTLFVLVPLVGVPITFFTRKVRKYASQSQTALGALTSHLKEVLVGIRIVKSFQREAFESEKLAEQNRRFLKYGLREMLVVAGTTPIMSLVGMIIIVSFVIYGSIVIQSGGMTRGDFLFYVLVIYQLYQPIKRMARANSEIQQAVGVLPRIDEILNWENDVLDPPKPEQFRGFPDVDSIRFEKVCFNYGEASDPAAVLLDVDLEVKKGQLIALVGPSGSGKSTLVNLLPRFYDVTAGRILLNGLDIRHMSKHDLRALFGIVTQDTILFNDTVHHNIAYGLPDCSREKVIEAAKRAFAHQFVEALPLGYDTVIGESGDNLSGGQRQRLSIARAFLKDAPILILDEATSALDTESEREVQMALENLMITKTTFVIAHRLSTIRKAHGIVVLNGGRVVEMGSHEALLRSDGFYRRLIQLQEEGLHAL